MGGTREARINRRRRRNRGYEQPVTYWYSKDHYQERKNNGFTSKKSTKKNFYSKT